MNIHNAPDRTISSESVVVQFSTLSGIPLVKPGDVLSDIILGALKASNETLREGDILVIAQKIVSKAEGRLVRLDDVIPSARALDLANEVNKDPRLVELILRESDEVVRHRRDVLVVAQKLGLVIANAGIDQSNIEQGGNDGVALLLPENPDRTCATIAAELSQKTGAKVGVIINDSHGRAWRIGTVGISIGCAGLPPLWDQRGLHDLFGYELMSSEECIADELAAAASLLMGQSAEGQPVIIIRGYQWPTGHAPAPARTLQRPANMDAFR